MAKGKSKSGSKKTFVGVQFPPGAALDRNSTQAVKAALQASTGAADAAAAAGLGTEKNWRFSYNVHLVKNCELLAAGSEAGAAAIAEAGLSNLHGHFEYVDAHGAARPLAEAMRAVPGLVADRGGFDCAVVAGRRASSEAGPCRVPYGGRFLEGGRLRQQLQQWVNNGIIETDALDALGKLSDCACLDLSGHTFACIGASSEMGPTSMLLEHGATVLAIDVPRPDVWQRLLRTAAESRGTLVAPLRRAAGAAEGGGGEARTRVLGEGLSEEEFCASAGCNILEETPNVAAWLISQAPADRPLCIGSYVYLDGANFVRVALAADAVAAAVCEARPDAALACLSSPTECYAVPPSVFAEATRRLGAPPAGAAHRLWYPLLRAASRGKYCVPAAPAAAVETAEGPVLLLDSYTHMQGPNYAFAKQIQRWRMVLARSRGHIVSSNLGPMTLTKSILSNALIGAGVKGAVHFGLEPFYGQTSSSLLAMLLVHDLTSATSAANPAVKLASPLQLFSENALHVGSWNAAFTTNSYTEVCALTYAAGKAQPYVTMGGMASLAAGAAWRMSKL